MTALDAATTPARWSMDDAVRAPGRARVSLRRSRPALLAGLVLTAWVGVVLQLAHQSQHERHELSPLLHWLRDSALAYPAAALAAAVGLAAGRRLLAWADLPLGGLLQRGATAVIGGIAFALLSVPGSVLHGRLFGATHEGMSAGGHAVYEASLVLLSATTLLLALPTFATMGAGAARRAGALWAAAGAPLRVAAGGGLAAVTVVLVVAGGSASNLATAGAGVCPSDARQISYDVSAFETVIPLNGWGDHIPSGLVYGLRNADARVGKAQMLADPKLVQPLTIRANVGDCITVKFRNDVSGRRVGMHTDGLVRMDPKDTDGTRVGNNPDSTVAAGQEITYTWYADREGEAPLVDAANLDASGAARPPEDPNAPHVEDPNAPHVEDPNAPNTHPSIQRGLYGAVVVHPKGSTWHNQVTGQDMLQGGRAVETQVFADIRNPSVPDYRSFTLVMLDENEDVRDKNGQPPTFPTTGLEDSTFGFNYRAEPLRNRLRAIMDHRAGETVTLPSGKVIRPEDHFCDGYDPEQQKVVDDPGAKCMSEESHLQSWVFGDEGKLVTGAETITDILIPKAYKGDPVKYHLIHPGAEESHPFHQHTMRWYADPGNKKSSRNDVQLLGPGESRLLDIEGGAGSTTGTIGDSIFHCHLYPHFAQGFWGHMRIFDRLRDGTQKYPDGTELETLKELPERAGKTPAVDATHPGFPLFVKGDLGQRAYRPPFAVTKDDFAPLRRKGDAPRTPTALETANLPALNAARPGAAYVDPCPTGAPVRVYRPHAVDVPITYNKAGWKDPEGRMFVEEADVAAVRAGTKQPEPYTIRARVGECVEVRTSNDLHLDDDPTKPIDHLNKKDGTYMEETETSEISTHVHLVKFDELGSDGTSVGWNYVQAAMPGQTYTYRWFIDQPLRTVFFHDHQYANLHQQKGLFAALNVEPKDSTWHDPKTGAQLPNGVGTVADIRSPTGPDFREFSVFYQDRAPMWRADGRPVDPPGAPDDFGADQGGQALNYRNEPFQIRTTPGAAGAKGDPAYVFSSAVHGDPSTPVFRAYNKDPIVVRNVVGSHEEVHSFSISGHRWLAEPDNPNSAQADTQTLSLAEFANYEFSGSGLVSLGRAQKDTLGWAMNGSANGIPNLILGGASRPGDYLYGATTLDSQWLGMWGLMRVPNGRVADLQPLPDKAAPLTTASPWPAIKPGGAVAAPPAAGEAATCPATAPARTYAISAMTKKIVYNAETGDHDPNGLFYALNEDVPAIEAGTKNPEPLFIRANAGDCVKVTLTNRLPADGLPNHTGDVPLPANAAFPKSARVSIHPGLTRYDVTRSDGAAVGYNYDSTVAPGASRTYTWYIDPEVTGATINLVDLADRRGHRHHGLWGALLVEPKGSTWLNPNGGGPLKAGAEAVIKWTEAGVVKRQREFVVDFQDGLNLRDGAGNPIAPPAPTEEAYEMGNRGINYRTERFAPRLAANPEPAWVMSSQVHGDPATPVFRAYKGEPVRFRVLQGGDRGRAHSWVLHGHGWANQPADPASMLRTNRGGLLAGESFVFDLAGGAGGRQASSGDYLFRDGNLVNQVNAGLWGLFRVLDTPVTDLTPLGQL